MQAEAAADAAAEAAAAAAAAAKLPPAHALSHWRRWLFTKR